MYEPVAEDLADDDEIGAGLGDRRNALPGHPTPVRVLLRGLELMQVLSRHGALTTASLSQKLRLARTTVNRCLATLEGCGFVERLPNRRYALTAKAAYDEMAAASEQIAKVVKDAGVDKKDIQSSQIYLNPTYDYTDGRTRLTGYTASITITVRLRKPEKASDILDGAAAVTGDALRLRGMSWSVDDPSKALDEARTAAMKDAQARAETLAKAGGADLGRVITIVESSQNVSPPPFDGGSKDEGAGPSVVIEPGTESIVVNVDVIYEID